MGVFASVGSGSSEMNRFLLHFDCPLTRKPFAKGLLSIFSFVILSF